MVNTPSNPDIGKPPGQLLAERAERFNDAIQLRQPDRVPLLMGFGYFLAEMGKVSHQALYDDPNLQQQLLEKAVQEYQPDMFMGAWHTPAMSKALGDRMTKWPGYGLGPEGSFQFNEIDFMKAEDYDDFLADPSDWAIRTYLPRAFNELEGFNLLPPLGIMLLGYYGMFSSLATLNAPPIISALQALNIASQAQLKWLAEQEQSAARMAALGFPPFAFNAARLEAPFDFMSDTLRGMRGIFLDMMRIPDKLLAAEEKVARFQIDFAISSCRAVNIPFVFIPLHRGSDGFMSLAQFDKFYWPQLKAMLLALIGAGITPWVYYEGVWDQRLKYLSELPKGKTIGGFQSSNIFKVKEVVGDTMCILGGMPNALLKSGTVEQVREHTKKACEALGKGGGFIMSTSVRTELENSKPELVKAWADATREFGLY